MIQPFDNKLIHVIIVILTKKRLSTAKLKRSRDIIGRVFLSVHPFGCLSLLSCLNHLTYDLAQVWSKRWLHVTSPMNVCVAVIRGLLEIYTDVVDQLLMFVEIHTQQFSQTMRREGLRCDVAPTSLAAMERFWKILSTKCSPDGHLGCSKAVTRRHQGATIDTPCYFCLNGARSWGSILRQHNMGCQW